MLLKKVEVQYINLSSILSPNDAYPAFSPLFKPTCFNRWLFSARPVLELGSILLHLN